MGGISILAVYLCQILGQSVKLFDILGDLEQTGISNHRKRLVLFVLLNRLVCPQRKIN